MQETSATVPETDSVEEITDDSVWTTGPDGELVPDYESTMPEITEGEVVRGTVVRVDKDEVLVDIGYKSEGVIPVAELSIRRAVNPIDEVQLGDEVDALVMTMEDADGRLILSKKRARFEMAWKRIVVASESGETVEGNVIEVVKGGLILDLGVRGFLPASLVDIRRVQNLDEFLGRTLTCKVIEINRGRNNLVLSRRAVLEEERKEARQAILDQLSPGDVVEGVISNIVDFGAFVDLNGIDGLIHISELSWSHVNHPSEILEISEKVKVKVLDIDRDRQRISLGLKQTQADPWQQVVDAYSEFDVVHGRVTKVVTFGAFVEILPGVEGLVHISELAEHHVETPREVVAQGDRVEVKIIEMDPDRRRLSLSVKRVEPDDPVQDAIMDFSTPLPGTGDDEEAAEDGAEIAGAAEASAEGVDDAELAAVPAAPEGEAGEDEAPPADEAAPPGDEPAAEAPAEDAPAEDPPAEDPPADEAPPEDAPAEDPPAEDPPADEAPPEDAPAEDPPAEDPPAEDPPADEAPPEDPPAEDPPAAEVVDGTEPADAIESAEVPDDGDAAASAEPTPES